MGKYYSRYEKNLYIYVTKNDVLIDLKYFPSELKLFTNDSAWRIKEKMAIVNDADKEDLDKAEIILSLNSYKQSDPPEETLEQYYREGNELALEEYLPKTPMAPIMADSPRKKRREEIEVIIPEAKSPTQPLDSREVVVEPSKTTDGVVLPITPPPQTQSAQMSTDELVEHTIDRLLKKGLISTHPQIPVPLQNQPRTDYETPDELNRLLIEALRKQMGSGIKEKSEVSSLDGLLIQLTDYFRNMTLDSIEIEKSPMMMLISTLTDYIRSITPEKKVQTYDISKLPSEKTQDKIEEHIPQSARMPQEDSFKAISQNVIGDAPSSWLKKQGAENVASTEYLTEMRTELEQFFLDLAYSKYNDKIRDRQIRNFNYLMEHWEQLVPIINEVAEAPHYVLTKKTVRKSVEKKSLNTETLGIFLSRIGGFPKDDGELILPARVPITVTEEEETPDYDVSQNRMVKAHLKSLKTQIRDLLKSLIESEGYLRRAISKSKGPKTDEIAESLVDNKQLKNVLISLKKRTEELSEKPKMVFLRDVQPNNGKNEDVHFNEPAYIRLSELIKTFESTAPKPTLKIDKAISFMISARDLYAKWCFMKVHDVLEKLGYGQASNNLAQDEDELRVDINEGSEMTLSRDKYKITLSYRSIDNKGKDEEPNDEETDNKMIVLKAFIGEEMKHVLLLFPKFIFSTVKLENAINNIQALNLNIRESLNGDYTLLRNALLTPSKKFVGNTDNISIINLTLKDNHILAEYIRNIAKS
jgi:hypothetical protein